MSYKLMNHPAEISQYPSADMGIVNKIMCPF